MTNGVIGAYVARGSPWVCCPSKPSSSSSTYDMLTTPKDRKNVLPWANRPLRTPLDAPHLVTEITTHTSPSGHHYSNRFNVSLAMEYSWVFAFLMYIIVSQIGHLSTTISAWETAKNRKELRWKSLKNQRSVASGQESWTKCKELADPISRWSFGIPVAHRLHIIANALDDLEAMLFVLVIWFCRVHLMHHPLASAGQHWSCSLSTLFFPRICAVTHSSYKH